MALALPAELVGGAVHLGTGIGLAAAADADRSTLAADRFEADTDPFTVLAVTAGRARLGEQLIAPPTGIASSEAVGGVGSDVSRSVVLV